MATRWIPLSKRNYTIITRGVTFADLDEALLDRSNWMRKSCNEWIQSEQWDNLVEKILEEKIKVQGSLHAFGRKMEVAPLDEEYKKFAGIFNTAEMFRNNVMNGMVLFLQNTAIATLLKEDSKMSISDILSHFNKGERFDFLRKPTYQFVKRFIENYKKGCSFSKPTAVGNLPFAAVNGCMAQRELIKDEDGNITSLVLKLRMDIRDVKWVELSFDIPKTKSHRFDSDLKKISLPNVRIDDGKIWFDFSIQKECDQQIKPTAVLGVDLGIREPFVASIFYPDGSYSDPIYPSKKARDLQERISKLSKHIKSLAYKERYSRKKGNIKKAESFKEERLNNRRKRDRLRNALSVEIATQLVNVAKDNNASIKLENLDWVPQSQWDQSKTQGRISYGAKSKGIKVKKVDPRNTSQTCPYCKGKVTHRTKTRETYCKPCNSLMDRDTMASMNIAAR